VCIEVWLTFEPLVYGRDNDGIMSLSEMPFDDDRGASRSWNFVDNLDVSRRISLAVSSAECSVSSTSSTRLVTALDFYLNVGPRGENLLAGRVILDLGERLADVKRDVDRVLLIREFLAHSLADGATII
jgi:hypothetical protein